MFQHAAFQEGRAFEDFGAMTFRLDPSANQPPWLCYALADIEKRLHLLTTWEAQFIRTIRPRIQMGMWTSSPQQDTLFKVWKAVNHRKQKPWEKGDPPPKKKAARW